MSCESNPEHTEFYCEECHTCHECTDDWNDEQIEKLNKAEAYIKELQAKITLLELSNKSKTSEIMFLNECLKV